MIHFSIELLNRSPKIISRNKCRQSDNWKLYMRFKFYYWSNICTICSNEMKLRSCAKILGKTPLKTLCQRWYSFVRERTPVQTDHFGRISKYAELGFSYLINWFYISRLPAWTCFLVCALSFNLYCISYVIIWCIAFSCTQSHVGVILGIKTPKHIISRIMNFHKKRWKTMNSLCIVWNFSKNLLLKIYICIFLSHKLMRAGE